jgi:glycosyltransferase involved in cell wall biosynthesis
LTVLRGFARIRAHWPDARLTMVYLRADMLDQVKELIEGDPRLRGAVHLRGTVPHGQMEAIYNSADLLLQGSLREWSGLAVLEAMACGVVPVVTDIPSFRLMTDQGRYGRLFPPGDPAALAAQALSVDLAELPRLSAEIRDHFDRCLSFPALARQLQAIYADVLRTQPSPAADRP